MGTIGIVSAGRTVNSNFPRHTRNIAKFRIDIINDARGQSTIKINHIFIRRVAEVVTRIRRIAQSNHQGVEIGIRIKKIRSCKHISTILGDTRGTQEINLIGGNVKSKVVPMLGFG